jgi:hypothetical protein
MADERMEHWWNDAWQGKTEVLGKHSVSGPLLSTINSTWTLLELSPGFCDEKSVTNRLNNGMARAISGIDCMTYKFVSWEN